MKFQQPIVFANPVQMVLFEQLSFCFSGLTDDCELDDSLFELEELATELAVDELSAVLPGSWFCKDDAFDTEDALELLTFELLWPELSLCDEAFFAIFKLELELDE